MADPTTTNYGFTMPTVGADPDTWGTLLNTNWSNLDTYLYQAAFGNHGKCRFAYSSATACVLSAYAGNGLLIGGVLEIIPTAGVSLANTGLSANTLYYVYAEMVSGTMTLVASTTGYTVQSNGVATQTGNTALTLVGMVYTNASSQFVDTATSRYVASYFNRRSRGLFTTETTYTTTSTTQTGITGLLNIIAWADEDVYGYAAGSMQLSASSGFVRADLFLDSGQIQTSIASITGASQQYPLAFYSAVPTPADGVHTLQIKGLVSSGTGTYQIGWGATTRI